MYSDDDLLGLSGIQHYAFCRRQWALIHIEQLWADNGLTALGNVAHERAHDEVLRERRGDCLIVRGLFVKSSNLGVAGKCDVVEFHKDANGHPLHGEGGLWRPIPIEYKRGRSKAGDEDRLQLCCQAMCLEEMFAVDIDEGFLYYASTHSRERVKLSAELRSGVQGMLKEMHRLYSRRHLPAASMNKACKSCSLIDSCLPETSSLLVSDYIDRALGV